jgi:tetratricopeptide (TPR) repeat protein
VSRRKANPPTTSATTRSIQRPRAIAVGLLLVTATLAVYAQSLRAEFLTIDDGVYVTANPAVQAGLTAAGTAWAFGIHESNWHPLTWLSLMLDASLGGVEPKLFHATNVLLHLANTLLLFSVLFAMTGRLARSGFVALLFAVHPLHVESVAWVAERKDVLSGLFLMLGLAAWTSYVRRPGAGRYAIVALAFALGLMAKPMLVTFPLVLLLIDRWPLARTAPWSRLIVEKLPLLAMSALSSIVTLIAQRTGGAMSDAGVFPLTVRLGNALVACARYLIDTVWPLRLAFFYPHPGGGLPAWQVVASGAALVAISIGAFRTSRRYPYLAMGWAWYLVMLVPVIGLVQVGLQARADRYTYLPLIGVFIAVVWGVSDLAARVAGDRARKAAVIAMGALVAAALIVTARVEAGRWHDSVTLYERALAVTEDNAAAHNDLGLALLERGDLDGAIRHSREALRLDPVHAEAPNTLATALSRRGLAAQSVAVYREALRNRPGDVTFHSNLGTVLAEQGDFPAAAAEFQEALRLAPGSASAHYNMGVLFARRQQWDQAIEELTAAQRLDPFDAEIGRNLDQARALRGSAPR